MKRCQDIQRHIDGFFRGCISRVRRNKERSSEFALRELGASSISEPGIYAQGGVQSRCETATEDCVHHCNSDTIRIGARDTNVTDHEICLRRVWLIDQQKVLAL